MAQFYKQYFSEKQRPVNRLFKHYVDTYSTIYNDLVQMNSCGSFKTATIKCQQRRGRKKKGGE
jgi:hypothetical protein